MCKLSSIIINQHSNEEAHEACLFIYYKQRPLFGKRRKVEFDDQLEDAWGTLRELLDSPKADLRLHKLIRRGFAVEVTNV